MSNRTTWFLSGVLLVGVLIAFGASPAAAIVIAVCAHAVHEAVLQKSAAARRVRKQFGVYKEPKIL